MKGTGERFAHLFGKSYVWVRREDGVLTLRRIIPGEFVKAMEEAAKEAAASLS